MLTCWNEKYCIKGLEDLCLQFWDSSVSAENVCTMYEQARFFALSGLVSKCKTIMKENELKVIKGNDILKLHHDSLIDFLVNGSLSDNEVDYFQAANRWSEEECKRQETDVIPENKRKVLGPALHEIKVGFFHP